MDKVFPSVESAIADVEDGCTVAFVRLRKSARLSGWLVGCLGRFGSQESDPCVQLARGRRRRTNDPGGKRSGLQTGLLVFGVSGHPSIAEDLIQQGHLELQMVPQGILVERCRAAGAGIAAFFSPVGIGTRIVEGREIRTFGGCSYVLEEALPVDLALLRAWKADRAGNVVFRGGNQSFNPAFGKRHVSLSSKWTRLSRSGRLIPTKLTFPGSSFNEWCNHRSL